MESDHRVLRHPPCRLKAQDIGALPCVTTPRPARAATCRPTYASNLDRGACLGDIALQAVWRRGVWCRTCETAGTPSPDKHALAAELLLQTCKLASEFF
jgi:hypothetical protein